jgi:hypothetical protein
MLCKTAHIKNLIKINIFFKKKLIYIKFKKITNESYQPLKKSIKSYNKILFQKTHKIRH